MKAFFIQWWLDIIYKYMDLICMDMTNVYNIYLDMTDTTYL